MTHPLISVVTPSFNQAQFLERTITSVLDQNYPRLEYIIMDGGSTDASVDIIKRYANRLTYWVSQKDRGQSDAINQGFARSTGAILGWLNSDDYLMPGSLAAVAESHARRPDAGAWVGDCQLVTSHTDEKELVRADALDLDALGAHGQEVFLGQPSCFFSAEAWKKCGPLDENLHLSMDLDLWLKMLKHYRFERVNALLSCATRHADAKTVVQRHRSLAQSWLVRARHGFFETVENEIVQMIAKAEADAARVQSFTRNPIYRLARPVLKMFGVVGGFEK